MDLATIDAKLAGSNLWPAERANLNILREQLAHQSPKERLNHMNVLAIDPGPSASAYVIIGDDYRPLAFGKVPNLDLLTMLGDTIDNRPYGSAVIEMIASYGMAVGAEVFETVRWIGRYEQALTMQGHQVTLTYRLAVKKHLCHDGHAKDGNIIQALTDRFAYGVNNHGKGTKLAKGFFYGFAADVWQAFALAVTHLDLNPPTPQQPPGHQLADQRKQVYVNSKPITIPASQAVNGTIILTNEQIEDAAMIAIEDPHPLLAEPAETKFDSADRSAAGDGSSPPRTRTTNTAPKRPHPLYRHRVMTVPAKTQGIGSDWAPVDMETR